MDPERIVSLIFVASIIITLTTGAGYMFRRHMAFQEKRLEVLEKKAAARDEARAVDTRLLEERVRVLERIATDRGVDIALEIDSLRALEDASSDAARTKLPEVAQ